MKTSSKSGYSILEALVAAAILILVAAAAASLSGGLTQIETMGQQNAVALNYQEQAARLWQLGMEPADIWGTNGILPTNAVVTNVSFTVVTNVSFDSYPLPDVAKIFTVDSTVCRIDFLQGAEVEGQPVVRTNEVTVIRPIFP